MSDFDTQRQLICEMGRRMYQREFVAAHEGNLSVRANDHFLCTPTMHCKGHLQPTDLCIVDSAMNIVDGNNKPTSEIRLHLEIYRNRKDVGAVVHSHPPYATAFAVANCPFPCAVLAEPDLFLGEVALAPFEVPGTDAFAKSILPYVQETNAIILANHGVVTYAADLKTAFWMTEILESACKTVILSASIGGPKQLSREQGIALAKARENFGFKDTRQLDDPGYDVRSHPLFAEKMNANGIASTFFERRRHDGDHQIE